MTSLVMLTWPAVELTIKNDLNLTNESSGDLASYHNCLMMSYLSYLRSAGYSRFASNMRLLEQGARRFLRKFPDPEIWLSLSVEKQRECDCKERSFVHYLILRRLLPMPLPYMLTRKPRFFQMAIRLMERETYEFYSKAAQRLGYRRQSIDAQFRSLLCLMI